MYIVQTRKPRGMNGYPTLLRHVGFLLPLMLLSSMVNPAFSQTQTQPLVPLSQGQGTSTGKISSNQAPQANVGALTDEPMFPGQTVHVMVFSAPDFSTEMQISEGGDIAVPVVGVVHVAGLNSVQAGQLIEGRLRDLHIVLDPHVTVTIDAPNTGITVLGEVKNPGIYQPLGKHLMSDILAAAGGLTANTGRVIEISNQHTPDKKEEISWDPTMHNTASYSYMVHPGDRVYVKACGIAYVGGNVAKPGAYSLCGSPTITLSQLVAMAGGINRFTSEKKTYLIRILPDGSKVAQQIDVHRVLTAQQGDPSIHEDDIIYVSPSPMKQAINQAVLWAMGTTTTLLYIYH